MFKSHNLGDMKYEVVVENQFILIFYNISSAAATIFEQSYFL